MFGRRDPLDGGELADYGDMLMMDCPGEDEDPGLEGMVVLENSEGNHRIVWAGEFAEALMRRQVGMVVLNTCDSGQRRGGPLFEWSGLAAALLEHGMPAVVGMQLKISDTAAHAFSAGFYYALANGGGLDEAMAMARRQIFGLDHTDNRDHEDWGVPVLYLRSPDGVVFTARRGPKKRSAKKKPKKRGKKAR